MDLNNTKPNIKKLIELSMNLRDGSREKEKYVTLLQEISFFVNFCQVFIDDEGLVKHFFKVTHNVIPTPLGETLLLNIQNATTELVFNSTYWSFSLQQATDDAQHNRKFSSTFALEKSLTPGNGESISVALPLEPFYKIVFTLNLIFTFSFDEKTFQRLFPCGEIEIDVLHMLSPGRRLDVLPPTGPIQRYFETNNGDHGELPAKRALPSVKFEVRSNETLANNFAKMFLQDSIHRGFTTDQFAIGPKSSNELVTYVGSEEVKVEIGPGKIVIRTFCGLLLSAVKQALMKRLQTLEGLELECPSDNDLEELYQLKLDLSCTGDEDSDIAKRREELEAAFLRLRKITERIGFNLSGNTKTDQFF